MVAHVFISYNHASDQGYVDQLARYLGDHGIPVWYDKDIISGDRWIRVIRQQIDTCAALLVVMTPQAEQSQWVEREIEWANFQRRPVRGLLLRGAVFFQLINLQCEIATDGRMPGMEFVNDLRALVEAATDSVTPSEASARTGTSPPRPQPIAPQMFETAGYTQAVTLLGNERSTVRLGGVLALARIADAAEHDREMCLSLLCEYLRGHYDRDNDVHHDEGKVRNAAITAVTDRLRPTHPGFWSNATLDLGGADLDEINLGGCTADALLLRSITVHGFAAFGDPVLGGTFGQTFFEGSVFNGPVAFYGATFRGTHLTGVHFRDRATFQRTTFALDDVMGGTWYLGTPVGYGNTGPLWGKVDPAVADLGQMFHVGTLFDGAQFDADVNFSEAIFEGDATFSGAVFLKPPDFSRAQFRGKSYFINTVFPDGTSLSRANFATPPTILSDPTIP
jgi:uncharacterized protein YjbI with pentapeptide repeats